MAMNQLKKFSSVNTALIVMNVILFLIPDFLGFLIPWDSLFEKGTMIPLLVAEKGEYYRLFTSMFLHFDIRHLLNNMLVLFVLGERLEDYLGHGRYLLFYILCGIGANLISLLFYLRSGELFTMSAGASGAIFGVTGGLIWIVYRNRGRIGDINSRQLVLMAVLSLYLGFSSTGVNNAAHVGGLVTGTLLGIPFHGWVSRAGNSSRRSKAGSL